MWVLPIRHPADLLRGRWGFHPANIEYLRRAKELAAGEWEPSPLVPPERALTLHTGRQLRGFFDWARTHPKPWVTMDIECAGPHLVCVGVMHMVTEEYVCVRIRNQGGELAWPLAELTTQVRVFDEALCDPKLLKVFHNGQAFDVPYLEQLGFGPIQGYAGDTMLAQRYLYPDMPAKLEFVAGLYARIPAWKWMAKLEGEEEDK